MRDDRPQEEAYLRDALACLAWELAHIDERFRAGVEAGDETAEESVRQILERRYRQLLMVKDSPYFARIDFTPDGGPSESCYLGKATVTDEDRNLKVIDWRAPVASVYYEYRLGPAAYDSPERRVTGQLTRKRQYAIQGGALRDYEDIDITSDDELLRPYLTVSADARLKNIISTIQTEQNAIIRAPLGQPLIVQGAAGSGKTTVMNIIGLIDTATRGGVFINGQEVNGLKRDELTRMRQEVIGFIFQSFNLLPVLTVFENIELPLLLGKKGGRSSALNKVRRKERVEGLLEEVGLADRRNHLPAELSGGQQQRVAIARAL
ncbi:MAG: ATP-binding cassette domain-containing protein, partial [Oscillospiraceae bacterium]|nr:ATP-binding cassette domain-containing protein [Oscillospiraceae bacterium]